MEEITLNNWDFFGIKRMAIDIQEVEIDGIMHYNPILTILLDEYDGNDSLEDGKILTINTDYFDTDIKKSLYKAARSIGGMFDNISSGVLQFSENGDVVKQYDLNEEDFSVYIDEDNMIELMNEDDSSKKMMH